VREFENKFAQHMGSNYAVMVNSGSSANLLMIAALVLDKDIDLNEGDEVIVPTLSWATTYYPLQQYKLKAKFVDINLDTLNIDEDAIVSAISKKTKAIFAVNVLGNPCSFKKLNDICKKYKLILIEDNCESLGAKYNNKQCGSFGITGSFSFYFSHHIHTIEGGMVITNNESTYHHLLSLRAHGWIRDLPDNNKIFKKKGNRFEDSFVFVLPGYNLRPNEINGGIGLEQLKKVNNIIGQRRANAKFFKDLFKLNENIKIQKEVGKSSWFGFSVILDGKLKNKREQILNELNNKGIETRPIISGNFLKYPVTKFLDYKIHGKIKNSEEIDKNGFFIGNNHVDISRELAYFEDTIKNFK
jgi:CDP-6-deoxy-D-xylo-4-hexulose-3-dehydrase